MSDYTEHFELDIRSVSCEKMYFEGIRCFFADGQYGIRGAAFDFAGMTETYAINLQDDDGFNDNSNFVGLYLNTT